MGSNELLRAQNELWTRIFGFTDSMCLKCTVELGIFDAVHNHGGCITLRQLLRAISVPPSKSFHLSRLMRKMTTSGFFAKQSSSSDEEEEDIYVLTPLSRLLVEDKGRTSLGPLVLGLIKPVMLQPFSYLSGWFKEDKSPTEPTPFKLAHGYDFWAMLGQNVDASRSFNDAMASDTRFTMDVLVKDHGEVFREIKSLVDVGGGVGDTCRAIARAFPGIKCTVLDLPQVIGDMKEDGNVEFVAGNAFEYVPPADAVLLKLVLHNWSDEDCVKILRRCKEAIPSKEEGGKLIVIDTVIGNDVNSEELELYFDLAMMVTFGSHERDEQEWKKIFMKAGYSGYKIMTVLGIRSVIEVYP
ncbi:trans-resveratrol di-O-methyltransferase-like [Typha angustifolia]|uniref:trans-resveratrol di-O-methyltransferase-like n=1 Tax=Typha angustifolia TaxID=59011 RepID=UPI003C2AFCFB